MSDAPSYEPVACSFHDELGLRMMRGRPCTLVVDDGEQTEMIEAVLADVFTEGDAEYVRLDDDRRIRLDRIRRAARSLRVKAASGSAGAPCSLCGLPARRLGSFLRT
jgi:transcriptional antiterminator Rof (Rho-off)